MNAKRIEWTQEHAAAEFGINPRISSARLKQLDIRPADGKHYSTKQIATAVYGDLERERIRLTSAEADAQERENQTDLGKLVNVETLKHDLAPLYVEMVRLIRASGMTEAEQDTLLAAMSKLHEP